MVRKYFIFLLVLISARNLNAQNNAVSLNEKLVYTASYNMSGILTDIAEVTMETSTVTTSSATLLRLKCTAATYSKWDNFFKIRDLYESYVSPKTLTPYLYKRDVNEGNYHKFMKYTFSHKTKTVKTLQEKKGKEENKVININSGTKDIVSTIYFIRLLNYGNLTKGAKKSLTILFDRKEVKAQITYLGKETINTAIGSKECYKLAVGSSDTNVFQGSNDNILWLTADENRILVYGKFKIPVGNGELKIKSASGLKN